MAINISQEEIERVRREIIERGKLEAPNEASIEEDEDEEPELEEDELAVSPGPPPPISDAPEESDRRDLPKRVGVQALADRLLKGRIDGARAGRHQSGPAPYGYRRSRDGLVPDAVEAEIVRLMFREYLKLRSMKRLIEFLDGKSILTRRKKKWSRAGVSWIFKNNTYIGRVHFGAVQSRGTHAAIVSPIIFNKVGKLIRVNAKRRARHEAPAAQEAIVTPSNDDPDVHIKTLS